MPTSSVRHAWLEEVTMSCCAALLLSQGTAGWVPRALWAAGQEPSATDQRFLPSLPRVQTSDPLVFGQAPRGQARAGGHLVPPLGAGRAFLMPCQNLCSTQLPHPTQDPKNKTTTNPFWAVKSGPCHQLQLKKPPGKRGTPSSSPSAPFSAPSSFPGENVFKVLGSISAPLF